MLTPTIGNSAVNAQSDRTTQSDLGQKDIFLKLLVAQMQNQDPLNPQDATQMSSQLAQFNMVEQQTESNKLLQQLVGAGGTSKAAQPSSGADYLGHSVTINQNEVYYDGTQQSFTAVMDEPASEALVFIFDSNGEPVRTMNLNNLQTGDNAMNWDGKTDSGAVATQGQYSIQITATNIAGSEVAYSIQRSGLVDAVRFTSSGTQLMVGGVPASLADITEIRL